MSNLLYLSRRNLQTLINKLDRQVKGEATACTICKYKNADDPAEFAQSFDSVMVIAVEDEEYYSNRDAGAVHPADDPKFRN